MTSSEYYEKFVLKQYSGMLTSYWLVTKMCPNSEAALNTNDVRRII